MAKRSDIQAQELRQFGEMIMQYLASGTRERGAMLRAALESKTRKGIARRELASREKIAGEAEAGRGERFEEEVGLRREEQEATAEYRKLVLKLQGAQLEAQKDYNKWNVVTTLTGQAGTFQLSPIQEEQIRPILEKQAAEEPFSENWNAYQVQIDTIKGTSAPSLSELNAWYENAKISGDDITKLSGGMPAPGPTAPMGVPSMESIRREQQAGTPWGAGLPSAEDIGGWIGKYGTGPFGYGMPVEMEALGRGYAGFASKTGDVLRDLLGRAEEWRRLPLIDKFGLR